MLLFLILFSFSLLALIPTVCVALLLGVLVDRFVEDKLRKLEPLNGNETARPADAGDSQ
jgi:hypothetical protein